MTGGNDTTRRAMLQAAPALALGAAVPAIAGEPESEIPRLFAQIERMKTELHAHLDGFVDETSWSAADAAFDEGYRAIDAVAIRMLAIEPRSVADLAMQVAWWQGENLDPEDDAGEYDGVRDVIRERIRRLIGYPGLGAAVVSATSPAPPAPAESEVMRLYHEWGRLEANWPSESDNRAEFAAAEAAHLAAQGKIEERMIAVPSLGARDLAAKVLVNSCHGDFGLTSEALLAEMIALVGKAVP